jgi:hypothetical protein
MRSGDAGPEAGPKGPPAAFDRRPVAARRRWRGAFTVVEVLVATLIGVNVLLILWQVFIADQRRFARDQGKLSALQGALLFAERLEMDLQEIALRMPTPLDPTVPFTLDNPVRIDDGGRRLTFLRFGPPDPATGATTARPVAYAYDAGRFRITRALGTEVVPFQNVLVDSIRFEGRSATLRLDGLGLTPPPRIFRPELPVYLIKYQVTASPETPGADSPANVPVENKCTLVNAVPIVYRAERTAHPYWAVGGSELPQEAP